MSWMAVSVLNRLSAVDLEVVEAEEAEARARGEPGCAQVGEDVAARGGGDVVRTVCTLACARLRTEIPVNGDAVVGNVGEVGG